MIFLCDADCVFVAAKCRFTGVCWRMRYPSWPPFWSVRKSCTCTTGTGACCPRLVPMLPFPGSFCHYPGPFTQSRCVKCMGACKLVLVFGSCCWFVVVFVWRKPVPVCIRCGGPTGFRVVLPVLIPWWRHFGAEESIRAVKMTVSIVHIHRGCCECVW